MEIGKKTLSKAGTMLEGALLAYHDKINEAFANSGDTEVKVDLGLIIKPGDKGALEIKVNMGFVTEKVKDSFTDTFNENQGALFNE